MYLLEYPQDIAVLQEIHIHELDVSGDAEFLQPGEVRPGAGADRSKNAARDRCGAAAGGARNRRGGSRAQARTQASGSRCHSRNRARSRVCMAMIGDSAMGSSIAVTLFMDGSMC